MPIPTIRSQGTPAGLHQFGRAGQSTKDISGTGTDSVPPDEPPIVLYTGTVLRDGHAETGGYTPIKDGKYLSDELDTGLDFTPFTTHAYRGLVLHEDRDFRDYTPITG
jgi:hypothetical protein